jgi:putative addiction module component (TIGR02574 family)
MPTTDIRQRALKLPPKERAELIEALSASLIGESQSDWKSELLDAFEREPGNTLSLEEVKADLRA